MYQGQGWVGDDEQTVVMGAQHREGTYRCRNGHRRMVRMTNTTCDVYFTTIRKTDEAGWSQGGSGHTGRAEAAGHGGGLQGRQCRGKPSV